MHNLKIAFHGLCIVMALLMLPLSAVALDMGGIRFGQHGTTTRVVMDIDKAVDFSATLKDDPARIVIELPMISKNPVIRRSDLPPLIHDIRVEPVTGISGTYSRLSLIMGKEKAIIKSAYMIPSQGKNSARFVLDLQPATQSAFIKNEGRVFGTLETSPQPTTGKLPFAGLGGTKLDPIGTPDEPTPPEERPLIVIDAGHGGQDGGAVQSGVREKDVTLAVARDLRNVLNASGRYRVELTRDKDVFIRLEERVRIARRLGADLFISIHADSAPDAGYSARGASFYTLSDKASDSLAAGLADRENKADLIAGLDLPSNDKAVSDMLIDIATRETGDQSRYFAGKLYAAFRKNNLPLLPTPKKSAGFMVLKAPDIPSVLIELGFLSNPDEAKKLTNQAYRAALAKSIADGIDDWFSTNKH